MEGFWVTDSIDRLKAYLGSSEKINFPDKLSFFVPTFNYAVDRFGMAYGESKILGSDEIVLLRQAIRWSGMTDIRLNRPSNYPEIEKLLEKAGLKWSLNGYLLAEAYEPIWLGANSEKIDFPPRKRSIDESFAGEPYLLQNIGFPNWLSSAQKEAVWMVLNADDGSTNTVVLPTGCGKSSCFWLLPTFTTGLTVVVVPTVALAIDQQQNSLDHFKHFQGVNPCFFASNDNPEVTVEKLKNKETRLIFASPETCVSGHMRPILDSFARSGWLQNLVIDEAHLIETWGSQFRVEFQLLAAIRKMWLESSCNKLRTFLFSATMTPQCRVTLSEMFSEKDRNNEFICQRLRPEMSYFGCCFQNDEERWPYLREAIWRLPRPAILYLTKPDDAQQMYTRLRDQEGFHRIGCFTGETNHPERKALLKNWKENKIDLMVATSAFGVGVDKADVRAVIHACYPENIDRYYQEVGRSGRDGYSSICLLIPTEIDKNDSKYLGTKMLKDENKIQQRWESMYNNSKPVHGEDYIFKLPVSVKRLALMGGRTYSQNIIWNKSLLLQLFRAQLIEFLDLELKLPTDPEDEQEEWATVRVNFPPGTNDLAKILEPLRQKEKQLFKIGFSQVEEFLSSTCCISRILKKLYNVPYDQRVCGGCRFCREKDRDSSLCPPLLVPASNVVLNECRGTIVEGCPDPTQSSEQNDFIDMMEICFRKYSLKPFQLFSPKEYFEFILKLLENGFRHYREPYRIDPFKEDTVLRSSLNHRVLFLHIGSYSEEILKKAQTCNPIHLFCGVQNPYESNGRHIKIKYNCDSWLSPEVWMGQFN